MSEFPLSFKGPDEIIPVYLELPDSRIYSEMIFDYATHFRMDPEQAGTRIDIYEYYEFIAHRNRRREIEKWYIKNN